MTPARESAGGRSLAPAAVARAGRRIAVASGVAIALAMPAFGDAPTAAEADAKAAPSPVERSFLGVAGG